MLKGIMEGHTSFNPKTDIPPLSGKVIFITGGTAGIGAATTRALAPHNPLHIYISGRNLQAGTSLISDLKTTYPSLSITFLELDLTSLESIKTAIAKSFTHSRLDILLNNAGIMAQPAELSQDGYEIQFATNYLGHAMLTRCLLPVLLRTAEEGGDVRVVNTTSTGYMLHPKEGICFAELDEGGMMKRIVFGSWMRYGHSKLANILHAKELSRRYPGITALSIHPGVVSTDLIHSQSLGNRLFIRLMGVLRGIERLTPEQGCLNLVWCAAGAKKEELVNGGFYMPVGVEKSSELTKQAIDAKLAEKLWVWTEGVLGKF